LQDLFLAKVEQTHLKILHFPRDNRSGILAAETSGNSKEIVEYLGEKGVIITAPVGYLRFAPHFYNDEKEVVTAAAFVNEAIDGTTI
jgi:selenocysteine lyase/cysteine desulfurase